ncbi:MAG: hypothetical protein MJ173_09790 [Clostridia bacterium]|nr:hypothetical protein [Clostridia bacterium]
MHGFKKKCGRKQITEISVPEENTIEYEEPQIEIPDTGSKKPFWAVAVCIIGIGAVFVLALI